MLNWPKTSRKSYGAVNAGESTMPQLVPVLTQNQRHKQKTLQFALAHRDTVRTTIAHHVDAHNEFELTGDMFIAAQEDELAVKLKSSSQLRHESRFV